MFTLLGLPLVVVGADIATPEPVIYEQQEVIVEIEEEEPREVLIRVDYSIEGIKSLIRETFPEDAETALKVAFCESGYKMVQSHHQQPYGRERSFGIFQIHEPAWDNTAKQLGLKEYQSDIEQNIEMARYIYDQHGWYPWSCYTKRMI